MSVSEILRENNIPIIDADNIEDAVEDLHTVFTHMDRMAELTTQEAEGKLKLIVAQMKIDYVQPYANWGSKIPFVLYSTHPEYRKSTRLDKGYTSLALDAKYLIVIISSDGKRVVPVQEYMDSDWKSRDCAELRRDTE